MIDAMTDPYPYNGRLSRWEEVAPGLAIVGVESLEPPFAFEPGQYATLGLMGPAGKLIQRPMSISSSADDLSEYEFFIRLVEGGAFTTLLWDRRVGDAINIKGPKGRFLLQDDGREALFVDEREPHAANALDLEGTIVYPSQHPRTRDRLIERGLRVATIDCSETAKAEGGVTCCSLVLAAAPAGRAT